MNKLPGFLLMFFLLSCNDQATEKTEPDMKVEDLSPTELDLVSGCFMHAMNRDTFVAHLSRTGDSVLGKLSFDNYQKDGSTGSVKGYIEDSIIKLRYDFFSEGMHSIMDVYFRVSDKSIIRGVGDMQVKGDTAYFTDPRNIRFEGTELMRIPCDSVPGKYRGGSW